ncbi:MAG: hypothetical protein AAGG07_02740 [Planctomycetota bacterium]
MAETKLSMAVLLAGGPRPSELLRATGRSTLDLHVTSERTVLENWVERLGELGVQGPDRLVVVHDTRTPTPSAPGLEPAPGFPEVEIIRERADFRGPAGLCRDVCDELGGDEVVLVAEAARYVSQELGPMLRTHDLRDADVTVGRNPDQTPSGVFMLRRKTLDLVPSVGFTDLKEQWLGSVLENGFAVWAHTFDAPGMMQLRTRRQLLRAGSLACGRLFCTRDGVIRVPAAEARAWSVVAPGAEVSGRAAVLDSIVMPGAVVAEGAVVARSVVCPGGRVDAGSRVVDAVVA